MTELQKLAEELPLYEVAHKDEFAASEGRHEAGHLTSHHFIALLGRAVLELREQLRPKSYVSSDGGVWTRGETPGHLVREGRDPVCSVPAKYVDYFQHGRAALTALRPDFELPTGEKSDDNHR